MATFSKNKKPQGVSISVVRTIWAIYKITPPMKKPPECLDRWRRGIADWITGVPDSIMGSGVEILMEYLGRGIWGSGGFSGGGKWRAEEEWKDSPSARTATLCGCA